MASSESAGRWKRNRSPWTTAHGESSGCVAARRRSRRCPASRVAAPVGFAASPHPSGLQTSSGNPPWPMTGHPPQSRDFIRQPPQHPPVFRPVIQLERTHVQQRRRHRNLRVVHLTLDQSRIRFSSACAKTAATPGMTAPLTGTSSLGSVLPAPTQFPCCYAQASTPRRLCELYCPRRTLNSWKNRTGR